MLNDSSLHFIVVVPCWLFVLGMAVTGMHVQISPHLEKGRCGATVCKHAGLAHVTMRSASAGAATWPLGPLPTRLPVRPPPQAPALLQLRPRAVPPRCVP